MAMDAENGRRTDSQFEIQRGGQISYLAYEMDGDGWMSLLYTEVAEPLRGQGISQELARIAFEYAKAKNLKVEVICPVALHFALKHPEYKSLIGMRRVASAS